MKTALRTAIEYAQRGWYVFPLRPGTKLPYGGFKWKEKSTNNPVIVEAAGKSPLYKGCNWALDCGKSNLFIVDVDVKSDRNGFESLPGNWVDDTKTFTVKTPSGGFHYYFNGPGPSSASKLLGPGIDTRGVGGYVAIPGSTINGKSYVGVDGAGVAVKPEWVNAKIAAKPVFARKEQTDIPLCDLDQDHHKRAAIQYLAERAPAATEGSGGDAQTFEVACKIRDLGVSEETALALMLEHWNDDKARPPWSPEDLQRKISNAYKYAHGKAGNATPEAVFPPSLIDSTQAIRCAAQTSLFDLKPRQWLLGYRYIPGYVTLTVAPGGVGKSLLTIAEGLSIASGKQLTHDPVKISGGVWLYNTEDPFDELDRRVIAAVKHFDLTKTDLANFYYTSGYEHPLKLVSYDDKRNTTINEPAVKSLVSAIKKRKVKLFILDPFAECHAVNENDNTAIGVVVQLLRKISSETECAISIVHHTSKGTKGAEGNMDKARGASSLVSAARVAHTLFPMSPNDAEIYGITNDRANWYVRLDDAKSNLAPPTSGHVWYEKKSIKLFFDSGETTGVLAPIALRPVEEEDIDSVITEHVFKLVRPGTEKSIYSVIKELRIAGLLDKGRFAARTKLLKLFENGAKFNGRVINAGMMDGIRGGERIEALVCSLKGADNV